MKINCRTLQNKPYRNKLQVYFIIEANLLYKLQNITWFGSFKHFLSVICSVVIIISSSLLEFSTDYQYRLNCLWFLIWYAQWWFFISQQMLFSARTTSSIYLSSAWVPFPESAWCCVNLFHNCCHLSFINLIVGHKSMYRIFVLESLMFIESSVALSAFPFP